MSLERNKDVARRWVAAFDAEDLEALVALCTPDLVFRQLESQRETPIEGIEGVRMLARRVWGRWQPHRLKIEDTIAEGDRVALRMTAYDTQIAPYQGLRVSGASIVWSVMFILRIEGARVAEILRNGDDLARIRQCGGRVVAA